ncbi:unnamed protein product [Arabidopsis thaliana]|uniref:Uncharacterized protein n=2 Tax=Arabidopsis thaliana TaxID=3702 RepID=A0A654FQH7_ARATH|nr:uncharacterized protein AT4G18203 [Arabidopsis thaliana]ANM66395.1 hypothetical protein AT4G18203 [Arabidopsis thaliana]CAA0395682.1 unnamed protein product [Arabidopsis thaliana]VYS63110.1 unnamed protein product [Arabidopsis thaliana]|eukprot:NP_001328291.1 hypothetical protein AT4G18203 [Arabidopsis thaliana]
MGQKSTKIQEAKLLEYTFLTNERKPQIAKIMEKIFDASILSWKTITAATGTIGNPTAVMELENTEDDSKINPTRPRV